LKENIARIKPALAEKKQKAEPASMKMTVAQTPLLIQDAQKNLPEAQQIFAQLSENEVPDYINNDKNVLASAISKELEKNEKKEPEVEEKAEKKVETAEEKVTEDAKVVEEQPKETIPAADNAQTAEQKAEEEDNSASQTITNYKGKMIYPPKVSAAKARDMHLVSKLRTQHKFVMPGKRRPVAANKRAGKR
jgi:hypothetical protein